MMGKIFGLSLVGLTQFLIWVMLTSLLGLFFSRRFNLQRFNDKNIHHGPALDQGIRKATTPWILTFDSDAILFKKGLLEAMESYIDINTYAIGHELQMNKYGFKDGNRASLIKYIHPFCALFNKDKYFQLTPFQKHGSPCLQNEMDASSNGWNLKNFPVKEYVYHIWEGTAGKYGYKLGWKSRWNFIKNKLGI